MIYISFNLKQDFSGYESKEELEEIYQTVYRPLIKLLNSDSNLSFSFSLTGPQIEFLKKRHKEFISLSRDLVDRQQLEFLGGGYYNPLLPIINTTDRNFQIDLLNSEIRQCFGKRPRGLSLFMDCWDSSLVNTLELYGLEYVILNSSLISEDKQKFMPLIMSELGKSVEIIPYYDTFKGENSVDIPEFLENISKSIKKSSKKNNFSLLEYDNIVPISFSHEEIKQLLAIGWFEKLIDYIKNDENQIFKLTNIQNYRKNNKIRIPAFISAGISSEVAKHLAENGCSCPGKNMTIYDYFEAFPLCKNLYNRILYVGMLINQYKADKIRKNEARLKLWQAQNAAGLLACSCKGYSNSVNRQNAYKILMEAEKILRQDDKFTESINCFDYNNDGLYEYICRMQNYFCYITPVSGAIQELDILKNTGNYADNAGRIKLYSDITDDYERGIFVDHVLTDEQFKLYKEGKPAGSGIFSKIQYSEYKFNQKTHEINLYSSACIGKKAQKIYLRKKYIINSTGMNVQYIIKNESNEPVNFAFISESNFANTNFNPENILYFNLETVTDNNFKAIDSSKMMDQTLCNVNAVRLTDLENGISFAFEPNEDCGYFYQPLLFTRPDINGNKVPEDLTMVSSLFWEINLEPGMETEKTINFAITSVKKQKTLKL